MKVKFNRSTIGFLGVSILVIAVVQVLIMTHKLNAFWATILLQASAVAIVSIGVNLIYGINGQFSLGQWGFYAIGAYVSADITYRWYAGGDPAFSSALGLTVVFCVAVLVGVSLWLTGRLLRKVRGLDPLSNFVIYIIGVLVAAFLGVFLGKALNAPVTDLLLLPPAWVSVRVVFFLAILLAGAVAAEVSFIFGLPVLSLGSDYFGIATLGFTLIVKVLLDNSDTLLGLEEMKGARGMVGIPKLTNWLWISIALLIVVIVVRNLLHSSHGRAIVSVREDEIAGKAMGIDVAGQKTLAFVLGSLIAGIAGSLYGHINGILHPNTFSFIKSFDPMIIIVFGGLGSITGTVFAAFIWALGLEGFLRIYLPSGAELWRYVVYPLLLLAMMLLRPKGLFGGFEVPFLKQVLPPLRKAKSEPQPAATPASTEGA